MMRRNNLINTAATKDELIKDKLSETLKGTESQDYKNLFNSANAFFVPAAGAKYTDLEIK